MRSIFASFGIAAAIALALAVIPAIGLKMACSPGGLSPHGANPLRVELAPDEGMPRPAILQFVQNAPAPSMPGWGYSFFCGIKGTDLALVAFAAFLVMVSVMQSQQQQRTAEASEMSARIFHAAMVATQRAYIVFREFQVNVTRLSSIEDIHNCVIQPVWENAGTTPTHNGRSRINWRYFDRAVPDDFDFADYDDGGTRVAGDELSLPIVLGPRGISFAPAIVVQGSTVRMVREMQGKVLIWGWAEYDDVFDNTRRHRTEFCYEMNVTGSSTSSHIGFSQYRRFNGVDEDCEREPGAVVTAAPEVEL